MNQLGYAFNWLATHEKSIFELVKQQVQNIMPMSNEFKMDTAEDMFNIPTELTSFVAQNNDIDLQLLLHIGSQEEKGINHWLIAIQTMPEIEDKRMIILVINEFNNSYTIIPGSIIPIV